MYSELNGAEGSQDNKDPPAYPKISIQNGVPKAEVNNPNVIKNEYDNDPEDIDEGPGSNLNSVDRNRGLTYDYAPGSGYRRISPDFGCCSIIYSILWYPLMGFPCAILASIGLIISSIAIWIFNPCNGINTLKHIRSIVIAEWNPSIVKYRYVIRDTPKQRLFVQYSNVLWLLFSVFLGIIHLFISIGLMCTIIFIPIAMTHYNLAQITLFPFNIELLVEGRDERMYVSAGVEVLIVFFVGFRSSFVVLVRFFRFRVCTM